MSNSQATYKRGDILGDYRIVDVLGQGGFGAVYKAEHLTITVPTPQGMAPWTVAIKELLNPTQAKRFNEEAGVLIQLSASQNNIVKVYGLFEIKGKHFLIMEYLDGGTVTTASKKQQPEEVIIDILIEVCKGLTVCHTNNPQIIHRDIKPDNIKIWFTSTGVKVKVIDLGIAAILMPGYKNEVVGTFAFSSMAQLRGDYPNPFMDMHSLGATAFHMMVDAQLSDQDKYVPFPFTRWQSASQRDAFMKSSGASFLQLMRLMMPNPPSNWDAHAELVQRLAKTKYSTGLQAIVARMMEYDDKDKFDSIAEVLVALEALKTGSKIQFSRPTASPSPASPSVSAGVKDPFATQPPPPPPPGLRPGGAWLPRSTTPPPQDDES